MHPRATPENAMPSRTLLSAATLVGLLIAACDKNNEPTPAKPNTPAPSEQDVKKQLDHVFKTQEEALEKAKQLQSELDKAAAEQQRQIDQQF
jgi:hypothetical protein